MNSEARNWRPVVFAALGLMMVSGVYLDGWAHLHRPRMATFFTQWHAILYGGFALLAVFVVGSGVHRSRPNGWPWAPPPGFRPAVVGVAVFLTGGVLDMLWHQAFGIEAGLDALLSPTHLVLLMGAMLMVTTPARIAAGGGSAAAGVALAVSVATTSALAGFFLSYVSVFASPGAIFPLTTLPEGAPGHWEGEVPVIAGLGGYLASTVVILLPILALRRLRPRLPVGVPVVTVAVVALLASALSEFEYLVPALGAIAGTVAVELSRPLWPAGRDPWLLLGFTLPAAVWIGQLAGLAIQQQLAWSIELWAGVVILTAFAGGALALLGTPRATATCDSDAGPRTATSPGQEVRHPAHVN